MTEEQIRSIVSRERKRQKMSLRTMGERTGLSHRTAHNYVSGRCSCSIGNVIAMCDALGIEVVLRRKGNQNGKEKEQ